MTIAPREGVNLEAGIREYGTVLFADPAWSYIHHERDAALYSPDDVACIERRIHEAAEQQGITLGS